MVTAIIVTIITIIALVVFIGLYIDETKRVQETYRSRYTTELGHVSEEISFYLKAEGDHEFIYRRIIGYMSAANSFAFLIDDFSERQKTINELYSALIKYPEQMSGKLEDAKTALDHICEGLDKGYDELDELIGTLDLKGN